MATTVEIKPVRTRDEIIIALRRCEADIRALGATALYLFGSAARNEMTEDSDVDLYIDYDRNSPSITYFKICDMQRIIEAVLGREVDLMTRYGLHPLLHDEIEQSSIRVF